MLRDRGWRTDVQGLGLWNDAARAGTEGTTLFPVLASMGVPVPVTVGDSEAGSLETYLHMADIDGLRSLLSLEGVDPHAADAAADGPPRLIDINSVRFSDGNALDVLLPYLEKTKVAVEGVNILPRQYIDAIKFLLESGFAINGLREDDFTYHRENQYGPRLIAQMIFYMVVLLRKLMKLSKNMI